MADKHWLARASVAVRTRYVHGTPQEDERVRHGRSGGLLLVLGAGPAWACFPVLPARIDHAARLRDGAGCLALGLVVPWLPVGRWPRLALLTRSRRPCRSSSGAGLRGRHARLLRALPAAGLHLPGLVFPPVYCGWTFIVCMLGLGVRPDRRPVHRGRALRAPDHVLASVCGRRPRCAATRRGAGATTRMRALTEAATQLGAATDRQQVPTSSPRRPPSCSRRARGGAAPVRHPRAVRGRAAPGPAARGASEEVRPGPGARSPGRLASGSPESQAGRARDDAPPGPSFRLVVADPRAEGPRGAIVVEQRRRPRARTVRGAVPGRPRRRGRATCSTASAHRGAGDLLAHRRPDGARATAPCSGRPRGVRPGRRLHPGGPRPLQAGQRHARARDGDKILVAFAQVLAGRCG
jgi:hypothetical protein